MLHQRPRRHGQRRRHGTRTAGQSSQTRRGRCLERFRGRARLVRHAEQPVGCRTPVVGGNRERQLRGVEGIAPRQPAHGLHDGRRRFQAALHQDVGGDALKARLLEVAEPLDLRISLRPRLVGKVPAVASAVVVGARHTDQQGALAGHLPPVVVQQRERGLVGVLDVVHHHQQRLLERHRLSRATRRLAQPVARRVVRGSGRRRVRETLPKLGGQPPQLADPDLAQRDETGETGHLPDQRRNRGERHALLRPETARDARRTARDPDLIRELRGERGLADPRRPEKHHAAATPPARRIPRLPQCGEFRRAAVERGQRQRNDRFADAGCRGRPVAGSTRRRECPAALALRPVTHFGPRLSAQFVLEPRLEFDETAQRQGSVAQQRQRRQMRQHRRLVEPVEIQQRVGHRPHALPVALRPAGYEQPVQRPPHRLQKTPALRLQPPLEVGRMGEPDSLQQVAAPQRPRVALPALRGAPLELRHIRPDEPLAKNHLILRPSDDRLAVQALVDEGHRLRQGVARPADIVRRPEQVYQPVAGLGLTRPAHQQSEERQLLARAKYHSLSRRTGEGHGAETTILVRPRAGLASGIHLSHCRALSCAMTIAKRHLGVTRMAPSASESATSVGVIASRNCAPRRAAVADLNAAQSSLEQRLRAPSHEVVTAGFCHSELPVYRADATVVALYHRPTNVRNRRSFLPSYSTIMS